MVLKYLLQKEWLQIRRNSFLPRLILTYPIMLMCVMPWVMNMEVKNIAVTVVDNDHSARSQQLVHTIAANRYFRFKGEAPSYDAALRNVEQSRVDGVVVIPQGFAKDLQQGYTPHVLVAANAVNGTKGAIGSLYLSQIIVQTVVPEAQAIREQFHNYTLYNRSQNFKLFMIPALFGIVMMLMTGYLPTLNIVAEKEKGTIEQMNVTPVSRRSFILSKLIPYWLIALLATTMCLLVAWLLYGIVPVGNIAWVYLLVMLLAFFFSSLGLVISNRSDTMQQAIFVMWFFVMNILLLSGLFTPTRSMPAAAYLTTYVNPMSYFIDAMRTVFVRGGNFGSIFHQVVALAVIDSLMGFWAVMSYKKNG